jgi:hypothetical protein
MLWLALVARRGAAGNGGGGRRAAADDGGGGRRRSPALALVFQSLGVVKGAEGRRQFLQDGRRIGGHHVDAGIKRGLVSELLDDRLGQPLLGGRNDAHLGEQLIGGGPKQGMLGQASFDKRPYLDRNVAEIGDIVDDAVDHLEGRPGAERPVADGGEREHRAQAEYVARRPDLTAFGLLGGYEPWRPERPVPVRAGQRGCPGGSGDPEVDDPRAVAGQQHVRRLEVTVHDAHVVDRAQSLGQPGGQRQHRGDRQRAMLGHGLGERWTGNVGRGQPWLRAFGVRVHDRGGEQAAYPARGGDLALEARTELGIGGQLGADDLHRDRPATGRKAEEHPSHAAATELSHQPVRSDHLRVLGPQVPLHRKTHLYVGKCSLCGSISGSHHNGSAART